ncbi:MAG: hypothetical protein ACRCTZ_08225 [Sarcina sp.]
MKYSKYLGYMEKLYSQLEKLRMPNGTFRASNSMEYNSTWLRDSFWCNLSYLNHDNEKYLQTCHTHLDFMHLWENKYDHKITWLTRQTISSHEEGFKFIHPKVNFDGTEITGLNWQFLQQDSFPYMILMMYYGWKEGLDVFRTVEDYKIMQLWIKAMENTKYWEISLAGAWEEEVAVFMSNMLLSIFATEKCYEMGFDVDREILRKARIKAYGQFPYEREGKLWDLTLLFPCVLDGCLSNIDIEDIVKGCQTNLFRTRYMCRYPFDIYKPFRNDWDMKPSEMEWCFSGAYMSIIMSKFNNMEMAEWYIDNIIEDYPDGDIPEGVNCDNTRCFNEILAWSVSMYIQAINKLINIK